MMQAAILNPGWDGFLVAIPFLLMMMIGFFHLDEIVTASTRRTPRLWKNDSQDEGNPSIFSSAGGRQWHRNQAHK